MLDIIRLFLSRVVYQTIIILAVAIIGLGFPITPVHQSLLSLITVGLPTLGLAAWSHPGKPPRGSLRTVLRFIIPGNDSPYVGFISLNFGGDGLRCNVISRGQAFPDSLNSLLELRCGDCLSLHVEE